MTVSPNYIHLTLNTPYKILPKKRQGLLSLLLPYETTYPPFNS
jgi:hypothetical protein